VQVYNTHYWATDKAAMEATSADIDYAATNNAEVTCMLIWINCTTATLLQHQLRWFSEDGWRGISAVGQ